MIRNSTKQVLVADGHVNNGAKEVELPFKGLSTKSRTGDTFEKIRESLMSMGKVNNDGNISSFTKDDVTVYKEEAILMTCKGQPIPLSAHSHWHPRQEQAISHPIGSAAKGIVVTLDLNQDGEPETITSQQCL